MTYTPVCHAVGIYCIRRHLETWLGVYLLLATHLLPLCANCLEAQGPGDAKGKVLFPQLSWKELLLLSPPRGCLLPILCLFWNN